MIQNQPDVTTSAARSTTTFLLEVDAAHMPAILEKAVAGVPRLRLQNASADAATLSVGLSWRAWGGIMFVTCCAEGAATTRVTAKWEPSFPLTVIDWGQGADDLRLLHGALVHAAQS